MAWEASMVQEGYETAKANLYKMSREDVEMIFAEQKAEAVEDENWNTAYNEALNMAKSLDECILFPAVWEFAEEQNTTDNGGFAFWLCPYGCHTVATS